MIDSLTNQEIRRLCAGRWNIPLLALMAGEPGSRFGSLARRLGISRSVLSATIDLAEDEGWVMQNTGHGHPLRPEYLLTAEGRRLGRWCVTAMGQRSRLIAGQGLIRRWGFPVLLSLAERNQSFGELSAELAPVTPRALSMTLNDLAKLALIDRSGREYRLSQIGSEFVEPLKPHP